MRTGFEKEKLNETFANIGAALKKPVTAYMLGGGAMCFRNQKNATKDLDLVFKSGTDYKAFAEAIRELGFEADTRLEREYLDMRAASIWRETGGFRLDLFVKKVCNALELNARIAARSETLGKFGKLSVKMLSNEDIVLFKGITERSGDADDIAAIVRTSRIDWDLILGECVLQSEQEPWYGRLCDKLVEIKEKHGIDAPITKQLLKLDRESILREKYESMLQEGMNRRKALADLRKRGFTKKELSFLSKK
ncbi:MAG: hypothetical protein NT157_02120 [Candidatus Micrarchaeota archaeon]|nr:hypothetical protein [Candidatus Micrarchaeota archaeon]